MATSTVGSSSFVRRSSCAKLSSALCPLITLAGRVLAQQNSNPVCAFATSTYDMSSPRIGPAHETQQFTPVAQALEALGGYFTSRAVSFRERPAGP